MSGVPHLSPKEIGLIRAVMKWAYANGWRPVRQTREDAQLYGVHDWTHAVGHIGLDVEYGTLRVDYQGRTLEVEMESTGIQDVIDLLVALHVLPEPFSRIWGEGYDVGLMRGKAISPALPPHTSAPAQPPPTYQTIPEEILLRGDLTDPTVTADDLAAMGITVTREACNG